MAQLIYVNGRFLTQPLTGVQRYAREVVGAMDSMLGTPSAPLKMICLAPPQEFEHPGWQNIEVCRVGVRRGNLWEQIDLPRFARGELLFSPANSGPWRYGNHVLAVQDAAVFAVGDSYPLAFRIKNKLLLKAMTPHVRALITVSRFSQRELAKHLRRPEEDIHVYPSGADHLDTASSDPSIVHMHGLEAGGYLFSVATWGQHKNLERLIAAYEKLGVSIPLVIASAPSGNVLSRPRSAAGPNVLHVGYVADAPLKALYENAMGTVVPSLHEGFGFPVVEAMRCGCPVACSRAAALPEVAGDAALYFDPTSVDDMADVLRKFISSGALRDELRVLGRRRAAEFTWERTARGVFEALLELTSLNPTAAIMAAKRSIKRIMDLTLVLICSPIIAVALLLIYFSIKIDSRGPTVYKQKRLGLGGREIEIWKFRSMSLDAKAILERFLDASPELKNEWERSYKLKDDPRITRFGRFLRHTSLDELPQLWNVLRGEMSLVGPRPIVTEELPLYGEYFSIYKQAVPGLTGLWQVSGRNDLPYEERVRLDVEYVRTWSIWKDLAILLRTIWVVLRGQGAY